MPVAIAARGMLAVLRLLRILRDGQAAALLDALDADGAVAVRAGQHDGRRMRPVRVGQGAEEQVDRHRPAAAVDGAQDQAAVE